MECSDGTSLGAQMGYTSGTESIRIEKTHAYVEDYRYALDREIERSHSHLSRLLRFRAQLIRSHICDFGENLRGTHSTHACQSELLCGEIEALEHWVTVYQKLLNGQQGAMRMLQERVAELETHNAQLLADSSFRLSELESVLLREEEKRTQAEVELSKLRLENQFQACKIEELSQSLDAYIEDVRNLEIRLSLIRG
jgi:hypothetical protein